MPLFSTHTSRRAGLRLLMGALALLVAGGCLRDHFPNPGSNETLYIKVLDFDTDKDITGSGDVEDATIFVFDENKQFVRSIAVSGDELGEDIQVPLASTRAEGGKIYVSAWGNILGRVNLQEIMNAHDNLGTPFLSLLNNKEIGNASTKLCPGEMFFGLREIDLDAPGTRSDAKHEIDITQKNARLSITVRGLPSGGNADDYRFKLGNQNSGYDFAGNPQSEEMADIIETGVFLSNGDFVSPAPFYLIHSIDPENVDEHTCMVMHLMQKNSLTRAEEYTDLTGEIKTTSYDLDSDGESDYIALFSGMTTNVLIDFRSGDMVVTVKITGWREVEQWSEWQ